MAGWIVTFIIKAREGGTSSGYISSGFFGGTVCKQGISSATTLIVINQQD